jgi:predicted ATPase
MLNLDMENIGALPSEATEQQFDDGTFVSELQSNDSRDDEFSSRKIRTKTLYGRTTEQLQLLTAYYDVIVKENSEKVIIHGESGSGKTTLVNSIRDTIIQNGAYFVTGKFFQGAELQEPYSAIVSAYSDVCDLMAQSEDLTEKELTRIKEELGSDGKLLKRFISNLSPFICKDSRETCSFDSDCSQYHKESTLAQFKVACKIFLRVMATKKHPIVMFIDDIQWMDDGSREILNMLLKDESLKYVLLILSYRNEEEHVVLDLIQSSEQVFLNIALSNLDLSAVHHIVTEVLGTNSADIRNLSKIVMEKSSGNPLHVLLFLECIHRDKILAKNDQRDSWIIDTNKIKQIPRGPFLICYQIKSLQPLQIR